MNQTYFLLFKGHARSRLELIPGASFSNLFVSHILPRRRIWISILMCGTGWHNILHIGYVAKFKSRLVHVSNQNFTRGHSNISMLNMVTSTYINYSNNAFYMEYRKPCEEVLTNIGLVSSLANILWTRRHTYIFANSTRTYLVVPHVYRHPNRNEKLYFPFGSPIHLHNNGFCEQKNEIQQRRSTDEDVPH